MSRYDSIGTRRNEQDAILRRMHIYDEYPFVCISAEALAIFQSASESVSPSIRKSIPVVLKALECYLAVTEKNGGYDNWAHSFGRGTKRIFGRCLLVIPPFLERAKSRG
jgi:hypothetical protein